MTEQSSAHETFNLNPLIPGETQYIVDAGNIHAKILVNDTTNEIVDTSHVLAKFKGSQLDVLKGWLYRKVDKEYKIRRQGKLGESDI